MRLRMSAASFSSTSFSAASAAPLDEAAICRYWANTGGQEESAKPKSRARECRRVMARDIARTLPTRQLRAKAKGPGRTGPGPLALRCCRIALGMPLEPAARLVSFLCQADEDRDDSSIVVGCWIAEEPVVDEALNRGHRAPTTGFARRTNNGHGSELRLQEECWFRHDQVGLE